MKKKTKTKKNVGFPLYFYVFRETIVSAMNENSCFGLRRVGQSNGNLDNVNTTNQHASAFERYIISIFGCIAMFIMVQFLRKPGIFVAILNAIVGSCIACILPALIHLKILQNMLFIINHKNIRFKKNELSQNMLDIDYCSDNSTNNNNNDMICNQIGGMGGMGGDRIGGMTDNAYLKNKNTIYQTPGGSHQGRQSQQSQQSQQANNKNDGKYYGLFGNYYSEITQSNYQSLFEQTPEFEPSFNPKYGNSSYILGKSKQQILPIEFNYNPAKPVLFVCMCVCVCMCVYVYVCV